MVVSKKMARRRVFQTKIECAGMDVSLTAVRNALIGRTVTFEKSSSPAFEVVVLMDGMVIGILDETVGPQVISALEQGVSFTVAIQKAYQKYDEKFKPTTASIYLKAEYFSERDQPNIEIPKVPAQIHEGASRSFFTTVAGVTHEGRQKIIARCAVGETLSLARDPDNRFDRGAIKVLRLNGEQIGFIPAHVSRGGDSSGLASQMDRGGKYGCRIKNLTGGSGTSLGVNIEIIEGENG